MSQTSVVENMADVEFELLMSLLLADKETFIHDISVYYSVIQKNNYIKLHCILDINALNKMSETNVYVFLKESKEIYYIDFDNNKHRLSSYNQDTLDFIIDLDSSKIIYLTCKELNQIIGPNDFSHEFSQLPDVSRLGADFFMPMSIRYLRLMYPNMEFYTEEQILLLTNSLIDVMFSYEYSMMNRISSGEEKCMVVQYCTAMSYLVNQYLEKFYSRRLKDEPNLKFKSFSELCMEKAKERDRLDKQKKLVIDELDSLFLEKAKTDSLDMKKQQKTEESNKTQVSSPLAKIMLFILFMIPNLFCAFVSLFMNKASKENNEVVTLSLINNNHP